MKRSIEFRIVGDNPLPKQSFRKTGGGGYTPKRIKDWQDKVGWAAKQAMMGQELLSGKIAVEFWFVRGDKRRVDFDNLSKAICDAMNNIVYHDDDLIADAVIHKRYGKPCGIHVRVSEIEDLEEIDIRTYTRGDLR